METKKFACPSCKKDLRKVGFITEEDAIATYEWKFNKKKGYFEAKLKDTNPCDNAVINAECNDCGAEISWNFLMKTGLI